MNNPQVTKAFNSPVGTSEAIRLLSINTVLKLKILYFNLFTKFSGAEGKIRLNKILFNLKNISKQHQQNANKELLLQVLDDDLLFSYGLQQKSSLTYNKENFHKLEKNNKENLNPNFYD